jgi:hypothetical protein
MQMAAHKAIDPVEYANMTGTINASSNTTVTTHTRLLFLSVSPMAGNTKRPTPLNMPHSIINVMIVVDVNPSAPRKLAHEPISIRPMEMFKNINNQHFLKYPSFHVAIYENSDLTCLLNLTNAYFGFWMSADDNINGIAYMPAKAKNVPPIPNNGNNIPNNHAQIDDPSPKVNMDIAVNNPLWVEDGNQSIMFLFGVT